MDCEPPARSGPLLLEPATKEHKQTMELKKGDRIGNRYEVESMLGQGGMGLVLRVVDLQTRTPVALKLCSDRSADAIRRFNREVRAMMAIQHKSVMPILDTNLEHNPPYFVMPLAKGNLGEECFKGNEEGAIDALFLIMNGLQAIHAASMTHRDLKPANAMRMLDGNVVVSDLGLVKIDPRDSTVLTQSLAFVGTRKYSAPEQLLPRGSREADARTDIFQLGKTLYELVTGEDAALIDTNLVPEGLGHILRRATRESPDERFQTVGEMRDSLEAYRAAQAPDAMPRQRFESLLSEAQELLDRNEYSRENLRNLASLIGNVPDQEDDLAIEFLDNLSESLLPVMASTIPSDLELMLARCNAALDKEVGNYSFSFGEKIAGRLKTIFDAKTTPHIRSLAIEGALLAAVRLWRFAAMDIFDQMLVAVTSNDDAAAIAETLQNRASDFERLADRYSPTQLHPSIRTIWQAVTTAAERKSQI